MTDVVEDAFVARLGDQGDGVIETPDGPVFCAGALGGERVRGRISGDGARRAFALDAVLEPSPHRVAAPCPHAEACGGCSLQHAADAFVADWKRARIASALAKRGLEAAELAPTLTSPPASRRRAAFAFRRGKTGGALGFHGARDHRITALDRCLVLRPEIMRAWPALARLGAIAAPRKRPIKIWATWSDAGLDVALEDAKEPDLAGRSALAAWAETADAARLTAEDAPLALRRPPEHRFGRARVAPPPAGFLQATAEGEAALVAEARRAADGLAGIVDLFCGSGAFALPLAEAHEVWALDADAGAVAALDAGWRGAERLRRVRAEARDLMRRPVRAEEFAGWDAVVFDPPRAGAAEQAAEIARCATPPPPRGGARRGRGGTGPKCVIAVSCNPATFARDARILVDGGWRLGRVTPVDQFRWSAHVELIAIFERA